MFLNFHYIQIENRSLFHWYVKNELLKDGIEYAEKNGMFFIETSAKTADNINQLFEVFLNLFFL